jgi:hypothetical protein
MLARSTHLVRQRVSRRRDALWPDVTRADEPWRKARAQRRERPQRWDELGLDHAVSGTVGAAAVGALAGVPSVAFSARTGSQVSYATLEAGAYQHIYADAAVRFVNALVVGVSRYLPAGTELNVNFPAARPGTACASAASFRFVLSRVYSSSGAMVATYSALAAD